MSSAGASDARGVVTSAVTTRQNKQAFSNVELLEAEMDAIPCPDDSVDLIISKGVVNLSERKARVTAECARVLRPGSRLCVSDLPSNETTFRARSPRNPRPERAASPVHWPKKPSCTNSPGRDSRTPKW
jgi:ubiquinone/menaquinone biosynthesis C-methylase UbiE